MDKLQFKISAALKNLIGKELITDEYVAIFELVKNSFDAYATNVEIIFENLYDKDQESRIIIKDNGKGMNFDDLKNKWLFVAYSAKIDGTEDLDKEGKLDYRDKIDVNRIFAGAKGIGRFSCDRLGKKLNLITIKDESKAKIENLIINWEKFEKDQTELFINIDVTHQVLENTSYKDFQHGTVLEITDLNDSWTRNELLKLKYSLEKLINPNQENDSRNFQIELVVKEELRTDKEQKNERDKVNGPIKNFLFETLNLKTTQIKTEIIENGTKIVSELLDRGKSIYKITERNPYNLQSNIIIHLFILNQAAKINFKKVMGVHSVEYGSVFLYKNGFRIYPFGEEEEDRLGIDRRKQQGYARYLGTRELLGRIEINDQENIDNFKETTSRDGGLIKNDKYDNLVEFFFEKALKRLEKYVVDLIKWGEPLKELEGKSLEPKDIKKEIIFMISNIAKGDDVLELNYDKNFLNIIIERENENLPRNLKNLETLAEKTDNPEIQKKARKLLRQFQEHNQALREAERELKVVSTLKKDKEEELKQRKSQIKFFQSIISRDYDQAINFLHHVGVIANTADNHLENINRRIKGKKTISSEEILPVLSKISFSIKKIISYADFATKANYKVEEQFVEDDLKEFIIQYLLELKHNYLEKGISLHLKELSEQKFYKKFQPINFKILFDNLLSNSKKAKAKNVYIDISVDNTLIIKFINDGQRLDPSIKSTQDIFEMGFTTTKGSGLGLYHVKQVLRDEKGSISVNPDFEKGIEFIIRVKK